MLPFDEQRLADYSDDDLFAYIESLPPLDSFPCYTKLLSQNLIAKFVRSPQSLDEITALQLAHDLGIRVPAIRRTLTTSDTRESCIIMNRVRGALLEDCWAEVGWITTVRVAFQLRKFVRRMRSVTSPTAGGLATGECNSQYLDDFLQLPRNATPADVQSFICFWLQYSRKKGRTYPNLEGYRLHKHLIPPRPTHFVFTHQDLTPRNLIIDGKQNLWIIDWGYGGYYPEYFEYVGMENFRRIAWNIMARLRWSVFCFISAGIYSRAYQALDLIRKRSRSDPFARYFVSQT